jgi:hypothetical protein
VELPRYPNDGGAIAPFEGGDATHGARGDWPLPPDATVLTFSLSAVNPAGFADCSDPAGDLVVDLNGAQPSGGLLGLRANFEHQRDVYRQRNVVEFRFNV